MEQHEAMVALDVVMGKEPANRPLYVAALEFCREEKPEQDAAAHVDANKTNVRQIQDGESIVNVLIRRGGLRRRITVNGETYAGTLQDAQQDDSLPDDAVVEAFVQTTEAGAKVAAAYREAASLSTLFQELPQFASGFVEVLRQCSAEEGKSTGELQQALIEAGVIDATAPQSQQIHASYFTGKLERYGALVWQGKRWRTTQRGAEVL